MISRARHRIESSIILGIQMSQEEYDMLWTAIGQKIGVACSDVNHVQTTGIASHPSHEEGDAGCVLSILDRYCNEKYDGLVLRLTGSDYGPFEKRDQPYRNDRAFYHLGFEIAAATIEMEYPGYSPFRSTRTLDVGFLRDDYDTAIEFLPDYLWWELQGNGAVIRDALDLDALVVARKTLADFGFNLDNFGLYLTSFETLHLHSDA